MLDKLIFIAKEAGEIIKSGFKQNYTIKYKSSEIDLVTSIDEASERCIIDFIKKEFPTHGILSEESGNVKSGVDYMWVIDPLDGTTNFAHGLPIFSVSIALQYKGVTNWGVVYDIMRNSMYAAEINNGAYENEEKITVSVGNKLSTGFLVTGFPYDLKEDPDNAIEKFNKLLVKSRAIRRLGSAAIDLCYVASGVFDGFWEINLKPWDIAAGKLLVEEAGGLVTDFNNKLINIFDKQILATNKLIHNDMIKALNEV